MTKPELYKNVIGIYLITIEHHNYVGSSINLGKRMIAHKSMLKTNKHPNQYMQRAFNKYKKITFSILKTYNSISHKELLKEEKRFIDLIEPSLNLKRDPTTQQSCITTSKTVYQFNQKGMLVKTWVSLSEAARYFKIDPSNITKVCNNKCKQRLTAGFLWSYTKEIPKLKLIYAYTKNGVYLESFINTIEVYEKLFKNDLKKTVLSCIMTCINKKVYRNYFFTTNLCVKDIVFVKIKYVYKYDMYGKLIECFNDEDRIGNRGITDNLKGKTKSYGNHVYSYEKFKYTNYHHNQITVVDIKTNTYLYFNSVNECNKSLFPNIPSTSFHKNIKKVIDSTETYNSKLFKSGLVKLGELLEPPKAL